MKSHGVVARCAAARVCTRTLQGYDRHAYWEIGRRIAEFKQAEADRVTYGDALIERSVAERAILQFSRQRLENVPSQQESGSCRVQAVTRRFCKTSGSVRRMVPAEQGRCWPPNVRQRYGLRRCRVHTFSGSGGCRNGTGVDCTREVVVWPYVRKRSRMPSMLSIEAR